MVKYLNLGQFKGDLEKAKHYLDTCSHPRVSKVTSHVVQTNEKALGVGAGIYLTGKSESFGVSATRLAKFNRKRMMTSKPEQMARDVWTQLVQDIGNGP